jgi:hypothetical protein
MCGGAGRDRARAVPRAEVTDSPHTHEKEKGKRVEPHWSVFGAGGGVAFPRKKKMPPARRPQPGRLAPPALVARDIAVYFFMTAVCVVCEFA